jgi:hypothetical protein
MEKRISISENFKSFNLSKIDILYSMEEDYLLFFDIIKNFTYIFS